MVLGVAVAAKAGAADGLSIIVGEQLAVLIAGQRRIGLIAAEVGRGGIEEEQVDLEVQQARHGVEDLAAPGPPGSRAASPSPGSRHRRWSPQAVDVRRPRPPSVRRQASRRAPGRGWRSARRAPARRRRRDAVPRAARRSRASMPSRRQSAVEDVGATQGPRLQEGEALAGEGELRPPRAPGSATARPPGARSPPGFARPRGRSCRSPAPASAAPRGPRRCAPAAGSAPARPLHACNGERPRKLAPNAQGMRGCAADAHGTGRRGECEIVTRVYMAGCGGMLGRAFYEEFVPARRSALHGYRRQ